MNDRKHRETDIDSLARLLAEARKRRHPFRPGPAGNSGLCDEPLLGGLQCDRFIGDPIHEEATRRVE